MKNKILLLTFLLFSLIGTGFAQNASFMLQPDGSFLNYIDGKTFIVLEYPDRTKDNLYTNILTSVTKLYRSPKHVISKVDGEIISVNGIFSNCISYKAILGLTAIYSIEYILKFQFKEGKIRVDAPIVLRCFNDMTKVSEEVSFDEWLRIQSVFKDGYPNPKKQKTIDDFNYVLNSLILSIVSEVNNNLEDEW